MKEQPERLVPLHVGGESEGEETAKAEGESAKERHEARERDLENAPNFDGLLRKDLEKKGIEPPEKLNLALLGVEDFIDNVRRAQAAREAIRGAADPEEKKKALAALPAAQKEIEAYLGYGLSFEQAYREYLKSRRAYRQFTRTQQEAMRLQGTLEESSFQSIPPEAGLGEKEYAYLEQAMRETTYTGSEEQTADMLASLKVVYPEGSEEYEKLKREIETRETGERPHTKKEITEGANRADQKARELWEDPMVRRFWVRGEWDKLLQQFAEGKDVIETQSVIKIMNKLNEWERRHRRTTIGGVLTGPPGTGKTTIARHFLEQSWNRLEQKKGRKFTYIDLSEDITRYFLFGSKSLEFKNPVEFAKLMRDELGKLDEKGFADFVRTNAKKIQDTFEASDAGSVLTKEEAVAIVVDQLKTTLDVEETIEQTKGKLRRLEGRKGTKKEEENSGEIRQMLEVELVELEKQRSAMPVETQKELRDLKSRVMGFAETAFHKELGTQFAGLVKKNGWRDGTIIAALRRGESVILDEFNKFKNWSLIYGLLTAKPGEKWYFADNDEDIEIPEDWRMYFTANIGKRHGGFKVAEALASRAGGKAMEIGYPEKREEMQIALATLSDANGNFLRSPEDLAKLLVLVKEVFPSLRKLVEMKEGVDPISYRTLRDLGEKLVTARDATTNQPVYETTKMAFDEALYEILVESNKALLEDKAAVKEIVDILTNAGLLLDPRVKKEVAQWIGEAEYKNRKEAHKESYKDFEAIGREIRNLKDTAELPLPEAKRT